MHNSSYRGMRKSIANTIFIGLLSSMLTPLTIRADQIESEKESIFPALANMHFKSINQAHSPKEPKLEDLPKVKKPKKVITKNELSQPEKTKITFNLLAEQSEHKDSKIGPVIDKSFLQKMEIICGGENNSINLVSLFKRTQTSFGDAAFMRWLAQPLSSIEELSKRQTIIKELVANESLLKKLDEALKNIKLNEHAILGYFQEENKMNEELIKKLYFSLFKGLNKNATALEISTRLNNLGKIISFLDIDLFLMGSAFYGLQNYVIERFDKRNASITVGKAAINGAKNAAQRTKEGFNFLMGWKVPTAEKVANSYLNQENENLNAQLDYYTNRPDKGPQYYNRWNNENEIDHIKSQIITTQQLQAKLKKSPEEFWAGKHVYFNKTNYINNTDPINIGHLFKKIDHLAHTIRPSLAKAAIVGILASIAAIKIYRRKNMISAEQLKISTMNYLHEQLIGISTCVRNAEVIRNSMEFSSSLQSVQAYAPIKKLFDKQSSHTKKFKKLISLLQTNTFTGKATPLSLTGRVLSAHQLMKETKKEFVLAMEAIGEIDAYVSVAKLYREFAQERVKISFPKYIENNKPTIRAYQFWNPFVNPKKVVANDLEMGLSKERPGNVIITGPNTGGKSTVIKGINLNIFLAQTLCIAAAQELEFTPFTKINCYLNITDDIATGASLFKAEVLRAKALINSIRGLKQDEFSFTIMDEVFSGTSPKEGEEAAYMFTEQLGQFKNSMLILATHFPHLTDLENATSLFKNYQVAVKKDENGKIIRLFKLEEGKSFINIAMDLLKEEGVL